MTNPTTISNGSEAPIQQELSDCELDVVTGGSVVDTVVDAAKTVWNILTSPPSGVKGESKDHDHKDWII